MKQERGIASKGPSFNFVTGYVFTSPVGSFKPNAWGLYDMIGNVWQLCEDGYGPYPQVPTVDPTGTPNASSHVQRGGSWSDGPAGCRCANRYGSGFATYHCGFRVCLSVDGI
jgi:formylglycine-generating enzyme required for sulfatase activity